VQNPGSGFGWNRARQETPRPETVLGRTDLDPADLPGGGSWQSYLQTRSRRPVRLTVTAFGQSGGIFERFQAETVYIAIPRMIPCILFPALSVILVLIVVIDCQACGHD
jgi:hypothetical protein